MALYVTLKSKRIGDGKPNVMEVHIPFKNLPRLENEEIDYIQADCDELDAILNQFIDTHFYGLTIPYGRNKVARWYGDLAKTIYFNLC